MNLKLTLALALAALPAIHAQLTPPIPKFEAVSIKPCSPTSNNIGALSQSPGRFTINCRTVLNLIRQSYVTFANGSVLNATTLDNINLTGGSTGVNYDFQEVPVGNGPSPA